PHQKNLFRELPELRRWGAVYLWWLAIIAALVFLPGWPMAILTAAVIAVVPFVAMSVRSRSVELGVYAVVAWIFHAAALPLGFFQPRRKPTDWIESKVIREP
ncbi:glycosyltransferase family 2 protein, partial [Agrobacterium sp. S2]|nr:glycosyltransferase family 2 protein [Agrobacterium sp. S2]